jgi:DNA-directed RNA polymerase subunit omega
MVQVTIENCLQQTLSRFELVALASYRAEEIFRGASVRLEKYSNKGCVLALREIADGLQDVEKLRRLYVRRLQCNSKIDDIIAEEAGIHEEDSQLEFLVPDSDGLIENDFISVDEESMELDSGRDIDDQSLE